MKVAILGYKYDKSDLAEFVQICTKILLKNNLQVDKSYFDTSVEEDNKRLVSIYEKIKRILHQSDVIVIENTQYSVGIGLIIGKAIEMKKPTLVLFDRSESKIPSLVVRAYSAGDNRLIFREYEKFVDLEPIILEFISKSKEFLNTKYLFNLSPEMAKYLQWASEEYDKPMVDILREAINKRIEADSKWKKYSS